MRGYVIILGSSEGLAYAEKLQSLLLSRFRNMQMDYDCVLWSDPMVWENGGVTLTSLVNKAQKLKRERGFAVTLFTPDDIMKSRNNIQFCSRDNVWLEYGLFVGIMDISRVFAVCPCEPVKKALEEKNWRKPSDFQQYAMRYVYKDRIEEATPDLTTIATEIADRINLKFPRKPDGSSGSPNPNPTPMFERSY